MRLVRRMREYFAQSFRRKLTLAMALMALSASALTLAVSLWGFGFEAGLGREHPSAGRNAAAMGAFATFALAFALLVSARLARALAAPLLTIANAVHAVAANGDYSDRVPVSGSDEIGQVGGGINRLLDQMQARDRELARGSARLGLALEASQLSLWDWDISGGWVSLSERWSESRGGPAQSTRITFAEFVSLVHPDDLPQLREQLHSVLKGRTAHYQAEHRVRGVAGEEWICVQTRGHVYERDAAGRALRMTGINADVTDQRRREAELMQAKLMAESASRAKSQFLANMSHEIRTPMNGVLGMTELLLQTELSERQRRLAQTVCQSGAALLTVINDILDFSKIEAGKLEIDRIPFDLQRVVEDALDLLAEPAIAKRLELVSDLEPGLPCWLRGDPGRLRQVLSNLLSNAVKFTDGGEIVLRIAAASSSEREAVLRFEVKDTGIGIEHGQRKGVFQAFRQGDASTTRRYGGTGLGLAICRQLVELMGGEIGVQSRLGQGSTFWFVLPFERVAESAAEVQPPWSRLRGLHVLVVDDNATNRDILCEQMSAEGICADSAPSGAQALAMLQSMAMRDPYRIAVLDMHMPQMDGLELARRIREDAALARTELLMLSSVGQDIRAATLRKLGIRRWLAKPVRQKELLASLDALLDSGNGFAVAQDATSQPRSILHEACILLVEDNEVNQIVGKEMLEVLGYRCEVAPHGRAAIEALRAGRYALVLMDCQMPEMDGFSATRAIRDLEARGECFATGEGRLPIVALTAHAMVGDRERCIEAGMDGYIIKPFAQTELSLEIQRHLAVGRSPADGAAGAGVASPAESGETLDESALDALRALDKDGSRGVVRRVFDIYLKNAPVLIAEMQAGATKNDLDRMSRAAHSLKSSSRSVGAVNLADICRKLERSANEGRVADAASLVAAAVSAHADASRLVREQLEDAGSV
ncbi:MAG: response regulator [Burkholderiales bacterium]|nr:response regulator [Burkholderiales bacterium]